ncbi:MAG: 2-hydroxychromene-2-carboxylate isomerase [Rhodospirillaceae bacterium]
MTQVTWYFDVISPFAYLQAMRLGDLPAGVDLRCKPALFAGFLNHWGQLGPAEVPPKKVFIFRQCLWRAERAGIPLKMPPNHPFNPLRALRLCEAASGDLSVVQSVFRSVWVDGDLPDSETGWPAMQAAAGVADADAKVNDPAIKAALLRNGETAIAEGVFGVPTFVVDGEVFWGDDAFEMLLDYLADPGILDTPGMREVKGLIPTAERKR